MTKQSIKFTLEITLAPGSMPDEVEAALRNLGAWAGRMCQSSLPPELELTRWHVPNIACVQSATLYRECDWTAALAEKENERREQRGVEFGELRSERRTGSLARAG